jgi:hypothetical protein
VSKSVLLSLMLHEKIHLKHNSERTRPGMHILESFLLWNPVSKVEKNTASVVLVVCLPIPLPYREVESPCSPAYYLTSTLRTSCSPHLCPPPQIHSHCSSTPSTFTLWPSQSIVWFLFSKGKTIIPSLAPQLAFFQDQVRSCQVWTFTI